MPFPESQRVLYEKNPLEEVVCQLRFPSILRIPTELPASYQEAIRREYPLFQERTEISLPRNLPRELVKLLPESSAAKLHDFTSKDEKWKVTLSKDFLALGALGYIRWEVFVKNLKGPLRAFEKEYSPPFYSRIGLRYRNLIRRSDMGLEGEQWSNLLKPHIVGELAWGEIAEAIEGATREVLIRLNKGHGKVRVRHGLASTKDSSEDCYLIDSDFCTTDRTETRDALGILGQFNRQAGRLFRSCITDRLHHAMRPRPLEGS